MAKVIILLKAMAEFPFAERVYKANNCHINEPCFTIIRRRRFLGAKKKEKLNLADVRMFQIQLFLKEMKFI